MGGRSAGTNDRSQREQLGLLTRPLFNYSINSEESFGKLRAGKDETGRYGESGVEGLRRNIGGGVEEKHGTRDLKRVIMMICSQTPGGRREALASHLFVSPVCDSHL